MTGPKRLLDVLDPETGERLDVLERLVELPALVHVHLERKLGDAAHGSHTLDVEPVPRPELELQTAKAAVDALCSARHVVGTPEPDRPRGGRALAAQAQEAPPRTSGGLPAQVVEGHVPRSLRRVPAGERRKPLLDLVEGKRVVAEEGIRLRQEGRGRLDALPVVLLGR